MGSKYTTKISLNNRKTQMASRLGLVKKNMRNYYSSKQSGKKGRRFILKLSKAKKEKIQRAVAVVFGVVFVLVLGMFIRTMAYIQSVTNDLPSPDAPFGKIDQSSLILAANEDANTKEKVVLYKLFGAENRDFINIEEVPEKVKWAFLAAEDVDFYNHPGVDVNGLIRAGMYDVFKVGQKSGGSTITQQLVKQRVLTSDQTYERKLQEILLSLEVERRYEKDQILEMYLNVISVGGNNNGLKTGAKVYFNKDVKDLTLAEAAVLARIPQSPLLNSPTLSPDPEQGRDRALKGRNYVLDQIEKNMDKINSFIEKEEDKITKEMITKARETEMVYADPTIEIESPHFVFYVQNLLTTKPYNNGKPFDIIELKKGGYIVETTLDTRIQKIAEEEVNNGVRTIARAYGGHNGAAIVTNPQNGDILAMVGSKDYYAPSEGKLFDGKVNVTTSLRSYGSTMKPFTYYKAFEMGISSPGSYLPDVPIAIGNYKPKNWDGGFRGPEKGATAREQLSASRNIPPIILQQAMGTDTLVQTFIEFGYESIEKGKGTYGPSLTIGGGSITMVEHAQGFGVFATGGELVRVDPIKRIIKRNPDTGEEEIIYEKKVERKRVANAQAIYMVNDILNYKRGGPGGYIDGRDHAGKTGTSENNRDNSYAGYTPDLVVIGWFGNNDNSPMSSRAFGNNTKRMIIQLTKRIAPFFPQKTPFSRPGSLVQQSVCDGTESGEGEVCTAEDNDLLILNKKPPSYISTKTLKVCSDQPDHLAREIDEKLGLAVNKTFKIYKMAAPSLQPFLDKATAQLIPSEYCTISRSPNGGKPWAVFSSPANGATVSGSVNVSVQAYSAQGNPSSIKLFYDGVDVGVSCSNCSTLSGTINVGSTPGTHQIKAQVIDTTGEVGNSSINVVISAGSVSVSVSPPSPNAGNPATIHASYSGSGTVNVMTFEVRNSSNVVVASGDITSGTASWTPLVAGNYTVKVTATLQGGSTVSDSTNVTVN